MIGSGGDVGTGGAPATGGVLGTGGRQATGGSAATGGMPGTGGFTGTGVVPGDAANSTFYSLVSTGKMPLSGPKLSSAQLSEIAAWINAGALNN